MEDKNNKNSPLILSVLIFVLISSCGFKTIYNNDKFSLITEKKYQQELASITIKKVRKHLDQQLKNYLEDAFNPHSIKIEPKYLLTIELNRNIISTFTSFTGSSGRNRITLIANYNLKELGSGKVISTGSVQASDDFNVDEKLFANYTNEEVIGLNLTKVIADEMLNLIINDVISAVGSDKKDEVN